MVGLSKVNTNDGVIYHQMNPYRIIAYVGKDFVEFYFGEEYFYIRKDASGCKFHLLSKDNISFPCKIAIPVDFASDDVDLLNNFIDSVIAKSKCYRERNYDYDHNFGYSATLQVGHSYKFGKNSIKISGLKFHLSDEFVNLIYNGMTNGHVSSILAQYVYNISQII